MNLTLKDLKRIQKRTISDPQWFFQTFLNFTAFSWQIRAIHAVFDVRRKAQGLPTIVNHEGKPRVTIRSCHGTGKTQFLGLLIVIWNFVTPGKIACTAPKEDQLTRRLAPRYRRAIRDAHPEFKGLCQTFGREIIFNGDKDRGAVFETASDPDNLAGYHDDPQLFLIDEASSKRLDPMYSVIEGALTTPGSCLVEIGNPTRLDGEFYSHHNDKRIKHLYYRMHIKPSDAPEIVSQEWLDTMATKYGKNSPTYLIRCAGEFASYDDAILFPLEYIDDSIDADWKPDGSHPKIRITIDVADGGADETVITGSEIYQSFTVVKIQKSFNFQPSVAPIESALAGIAIFEAMGGSKDGVDDFVVDANGVGSGTAGTLILKGYNVIRYIGGEASHDSDRWRNMRVQCHLACYEFFRDSKLVIIEDGIDDIEELKKHLLSIKRTGPDKKTEDIITKEKVKEDLGYSPDRSDSLVMLFIDCSPERIEQEFSYTAIQSQVSQYDGAISEI